MTRGRRIATGLAAAAGGLLVVLLALAFGIGRGYSLAELESEDVPPPVEVSLTAEMPRMPAAATYADVLVRPLFNESRQPEALPDADVAATPATSAPLNVSVSGIIITRDARIALVTNNANQQTERIRVGQPLGGDQSAWTLAELKPRAAVFDGGSLGRQEIELTTDTTGAAPAVSFQPQQADPAGGAQPAQGTATVLPGALSLPTPAAVAEQQGAQPAPAGAPSEEEIRKRIEERRRQLREEAQRIMQQQQSTPGG
jgi:general secretion pathway protein N